MLARFCLLLPVLILFPIIIASCTPVKDTGLLEPWTYHDLRLLDADDASESQADLLAIYMRQRSEHLQIRLDMLEVTGAQQIDLYLAFDSGPGGVRELPIQARTEMDWDTLLCIPSADPITLQAPDGEERNNAGVLVWRDPGMQAILIDLNRKSLRDSLHGFELGVGMSFQAFVTPARSSHVLDRTQITSMVDQPPKAANVLLAFWHSFPAYTPATALRRWDGAHTGPLGGRHGLYNLLRSARAAQIPLILLDLNEPGALSALKYAGGFELVETMQKEGLLITPGSSVNPNYGPRFLLKQPFFESEMETAGRSPRLSLPDQGTFYVPVGESFTKRDDRIIFSHFPAGSNPAGDSDPLLYAGRWRESLIFPLWQIEDNINAYEQANWEGLTIEWRREMIRAAMRQNMPETSSNFEYLALGGSLPASTWGDPRSARAAFQWLNDHPWINVLNFHSLLAAQSNLQSDHDLRLDLISDETADYSNQELIEAFKNTPDNHLSLAAWEAYQTLFAPVFPAHPDLPALRANYIGLVWSLLDASHWANDPSTRINCKADPDRDGEPECILASDEVYAQFEIQDASLTFLFAFSRSEDNGQRIRGDVHQLVGPSAQLISGLSEGSTWKLEANYEADPAVIPGAFSGPGTVYSPIFQGEELIFVDPNKKLQKIYHLMEGGISIRYEFKPGSLPVNPQLPLLLDPWQRYSTDWPDQYQPILDPRSFGWTLADGAGVYVRSSENIRSANFLETRAMFSAAENPNLDFTTGHFLPFPMALVEVESTGPFQIEVQLQPPL